MTLQLDGMFETAAVVRDEQPPTPRARRMPHWTTAAATVAVVLAAVLRLWRLDALGFNSDEAVYAGQAASLAGNDLYTGQFPVFRAHPMLVHALLSPLFARGEHDLAGRVAVAVLGVATVLVTWRLGIRLYGRAAGAVAALLLAVMPYHVLVTRQVLLDGPMVLLSTLTLYTLVRYVESRRATTFLLAAALMGLTMLAKEPSIVMLAGIYAFFALTPGFRRIIRLSVMALLTVVAVFAVHPVSQSLAGHSSAGKGYLVWQLLRRPNHEWTFYAQVVPPAMGWLLVVCAAAMLARSVGRWSWRETLLVCWIVAPIAAFQLWPVKGYQYLLPLAPAVAVLGARHLVTLRVPRRWEERLAAGRLGLLVARREQRGHDLVVVPRLTRRVRVLAVGVVLVSLAVPAWAGVTNGSATTFLAGSGGVPGGREAGRWLSTNTPDGSVVLTLGPSMSNILQYYAHRTCYALSVSSNPLHRNPVYVPVVNPDRRLRDNELNYIVWDAYSAGRSPFFAENLLTLARRYHGRVVHVEKVTTSGPDGRRTDVPVIVVYEVRP